MANGSEPPVAQLYSVPRRFDLATIMVVTFAYALLLGGLRLLRVPPFVVFHVAGFFTGIGVGQALLFGGKKPRLSSAVVGAVYVVGVYLFEALTREASLLEPGVRTLQIWFFIVIYGATVGYFAGTVVGSVFLLSDAARKLIGRCKRV